MDHSEVNHLPKVDHTPNELDEPAKLLLKAAALIEQRGMTRGCLESGAALCVRGALNVASWGSHDWGPGRCHWPLRGARYEAELRLCRALGDDHISGPDPASVRWNNHIVKTASEMVSKLRAVALAGK